MNITDGIPSEIYVAIGRDRYDDEYEVARETAAAVRSEMAADLAAEKSMRHDAMTAYAKLEADWRAEKALREAAERKNRTLEERLKAAESYIEVIGRERRQAERHCILLAKLAADGPAFYNPREAIDAKRIRDAVLYHQGMNPDASPIQPTEIDP
jgi:hypothetical protein